MRTDLERAPRRHRRADTRWCRCRYVLFRSAYIQDAAAVIEKAHRVGAQVILDVYQAAGTVPIEIEELGRRLRGGRVREVAVRRPGCGLPLRTAGSGAASLQPGIVGWAAHAHPFEFATGAIAYADASGALPERHAQRPVALFGTGRLRDRRARSACRAIREKSLRLTRRLMELATEAGFRINTPNERRRARRRGHHRRARTARRSPTN